MAVSTKGYTAVNNTKTAVLDEVMISRHIPMQISALQKEIAALTESIQRLQNRAAGAMFNSYPDPAREVNDPSAEKAEPLCDVAALIRDQTYQIRGLIMQVQYMIDSLQV